MKQMRQETWEMMGKIKNVDKRAITYIKAKRLKILIFLLILSTGATVCLLTRTKYVSYVNSYSNVTAGDFQFSSNYLGPVEDNVKYSINSWDGSNYTLSLKIQNYSNSLKYNRQGTDFYYRVYAHMYTDEDCENENTDFNFNIDYQSGAEKKEVDGITYVKLPGMDVFSADAGSQNVTISTRTSFPASGTQYMVIYAETLPESVPGVFHSTLAAKFTLANQGVQEDVKTTLRQTVNNTEVSYRIICPELQIGVSQNLRVFFNPDKLDLDNLGGYGEAKDGGNGFHYIDITVYSTSITTVIFFKKSIGETIIDKEDIYYVMRDGETEQPEETLPEQTLPDQTEPAVPPEETIAMETQPSV